MATNTLQAWDPVAYARNAAFVPRMARGLLDCVGRQAPADVLDLGCGDGVLGRELMARGYTVRGIDASPEMVAAACARGLDACILDGQDLTFEEAFDVVFSNATLHWLTRVDDTLRGVSRCLRRGGEFVAEFGGAGNVRCVRDALYAALGARGLDGSRYDPWYFPSVGEYAAALERHHFRVDMIAHFDRPTPLPGDVTDWLRTFGQRFLEAVPASEQPRLLAEVREQLEPKLCDAEGVWTVDYVRLRFHATKR